MSRKIYLVQGSGLLPPYYWEDNESTTWLVEAHLSKREATKRVLQLNREVDLWRKTIYDPKLRDGVRASVWCKERLAALKEPRFNEECSYKLVSVALTNSKRKEAL